MAQIIEKIIKNVKIKTTEKTLRTAQKQKDDYAIAVTGGDIKITNGNGKEYFVDLKKLTCTCPDFQHRKSKQGLVCKHIIIAIEKIGDTQLRQIYQIPENTELPIDFLNKLPPKLRDIPEEIKLPNRIYFPRKIHGVWDLQYLYALYMRKEPVILEGPPGSGKNLLVEIFVKLLNLEFETVSFSVNIPEEYLYGKWILLNGTTEFREGKIIKAVKQGKVLLLDEINASKDPGVLFPLHSLFDGRRELYYDDRTYQAHPKFWLVATMNEGLKGTYDLNEAFLSRCEIIRIGYDSRVDEKILDKFGIPKDDKKVFLNTLNKLRELWNQGEVLTPPSTRLSVRFARRYKLLGPKVAFKSFASSFSKDAILSNAVLDVIKIAVPDFAPEIDIQGMKI